MTLKVEIQETIRSQGAKHSNGFESYKSYSACVFMLNCISVTHGCVIMNIPLIKAVATVKHCVTHQVNRCSARQTKVRWSFSSLGLSLAHTLWCTHTHTYKTCKLSLHNLARLDVQMRMLKWSTSLKPFYF